MKFAAAVLALALGVANAHVADPEDSMNEGDRIEARQTPPAPRRLATTDGCNIVPPTLEYLTTRYGIDPDTASADVLEALLMAVAGHNYIGYNDELIAEANDASRTNALVKDGYSGDINFPFGELKPIATVGEINMCEGSEAYGDSYTGVPDGTGAYLIDEDTVRIVVQSESYGTITQQETWPYKVNGGVATFTGSHVHFIDYDRTMMSGFMDYSGPASDMVKGFGQVASTYYNLAGEFVSGRNSTNGVEGPTSYGAHFSNTDVDGNYAVRSLPTQADWIMQSLCSAHLEEKHQWGTGIGFEDNVYITNEEWISYEDGKEFVGISAHVQDLENHVDYAIGSVTNSGFEKIVEINSQHKDYIMLAVSGYNGDFSGFTAELDARIAEYGNRPDGQPYVWTKNICPARIYVGVKGKMEDGSMAVDEDDFLAKNGLRYGKLFGFAVPPEMTMTRDEYHKPRANGEMVAGKFVAINWQWDGVVKNYRHDGAWEFQLDVPGNAGWSWWNAAGKDTDGAKTEHTSPDTRPGKTAFVQSSTAGYFGHYYVENVASVLTAANGGIPAEFDATYYVYQGENDITAQVNLGGAGLYSIDGALAATCDSVTDATQNCDNPGSIKTTFEDVDGFEVIAAKEGLFAVIQEDSGNELGERQFITKLEHTGTELTYMFIAMSGGAYNTRMGGGVGIPEGTNGGGNSHEFSGVIDLSAMLAMQAASGSGGDGGSDGSGSGHDAAPDGPVGHLTKKEHATTTWYYAAPNGNRRMSEMEFVIPAGSGYAKRMAEHEISINDKQIILNLQAHNLENFGAITAFQADRGGQIYMWKPDIPGMRRRNLRAAIN